MDKVLLFKLAMIGLMIAFAVIYNRNETWTKDKKPAVKSISWLSLKYVQFVIAGLIMFNLYLPQTHSWLAPGIVVASLGMALIYLAKRTLGRNFSECTNMYIPQEIITNGPYRFIRHPIYTGNLLFLFGASVALQSIAIGAIAMFFFWVYRNSAIIEEAEISSNFQSYKEYISNSGRFLPRIFSSSKESGHN